MTTKPTGPTAEEMEIGEAIMATLAGHRAEDQARALSVCLGLIVGHHHHDAGHDITAAELTLTRAGHLSRAVLRKSWGNVQTAKGDQE